MPKYQYSIIRFVPSPVRGEFVNVGLIIGSDRTGEWLIEVVSSMSRASRLDDDKVLSMLATDVSQLQSTIESYTEPEMFGRTVELSEDITQCWSLQIKAAEPLLNEIKARGWSMKTLRENGGVILAGKQPIDVPRDVRVGVVYAATTDSELMEEAFDVFNDAEINADCVTVENAISHAQVAVQLVSHQSGLDFDV